MGVLWWLVKPTFLEELNIQNSQWKACFNFPLNQVGRSSECWSQNGPELPGFKSKLYYLALVTLGKLPSCSKFPSLSSGDANSTYATELVCS